MINYNRQLVFIEHWTSWLATEPLVSWYREWFMIQRLWVRAPTWECKIYCWILKKEKDGLTWVLGRVGKWVRDDAGTGWKRDGWFRILNPMLKSHEPLTSLCQSVPRDSQTLHDCDSVLQQPTIVYLCKYFPRSRAFSLIRVDYRVYARASRHSRGLVASACAFFACTGAHQVENDYKDELFVCCFNNSSHVSHSAFSEFRSCYLTVSLVCPTVFCFFMILTFYVYVNREWHWVGQVQLV